MGSKEYQARISRKDAEGVESVSESIFYTESLPEARAYLRDCTVDLMFSWKGSSFEIDSDGLKPEEANWIEVSFTPSGGRWQAWRFWIEEKWLPY